jgi:hypothetical protein
MGKSGKKIKPPVKKNKKNRPLSRRPNKYSPIVYYASGVLGNDLCPYAGVRFTTSRASRAGRN